MDLKKNPAVLTYGIFSDETSWRFLALIDSSVSMSIKQNQQVPDLTPEIARF